MFKIINIMVFMFTHGYNSNGLFTICFFAKDLNKADMEHVGKSMALMLMTGIVIGTIIIFAGVSYIPFP